MDFNTKRLKLAVGLFSIALARFFLASCSQTAAPGPNIIQRVEGEKPPPPPPTGFLGSDYSLLTPPAEGSDQKAMLRYVNPNVNWSSYNKIMIAPVTFWAAAIQKYPPPTSRLFCNYAYNEFVKVLGKNFILTDQPGPGVMRVTIALTDATSAVPGLRSVSVVVPQARALSAIKMMATGSYSFVGSAQVALKANDSVSGELLGAAVDKRLGGTSNKNVDVFQWGDAENAIDYWATLTDQRLVAFGVQSSAVGSGY